MARVLAGELWTVVPTPNRLTHVGVISVSARRQRPAKSAACGAGSVLSAACLRGLGAAALSCRRHLDLFCVTTAPAHGQLADLSRSSLCRSTSPASPCCSPRGACMSDSGPSARRGTALADLGRRASGCVNCSRSRGYEDDDAAGQADVGLIAAANDPVIGPVLKRVANKRLDFLEKIFSEIDLSPATAASERGLHTARFSAGSNCAASCRTARLWGPSARHTSRRSSATCSAMRPSSSSPGAKPVLPWEQTAPAD